MDQITTPKSWAQPGAALSRPWFGDRLFTVGFLLWLFTVIVVAVPVLSAEVRLDLMDRWTDFVTLPYTLFLALLNHHRSESVREKRFWALVSASLSAWLCVRIMFVAWPDDTWGVNQELTIDVLYGAFYMFLALALEMRPDRVVDEEPNGHLGTSGASDSDVPLPTVLAFFAATIGYFIFVPDRGILWEEGLSSFSFSMYVALDLYLFGRMLSILRGGHDQWSVVYRWLTITFIMWAITDAAEGGLVNGILPDIEPGGPFDYVWYLPTIALFAALRSRWWKIPTPGDG